MKTHQRITAIALLTVAGLSQAGFDEGEAAYARSDRALDARLRGHDGAVGVAAQQSKVSAGAASHCASGFSVVRWAASRPGL